MEEARLARSREGPIPFIADSAFRLVDTDNGNTDRMPAATLELNYLIAEVVYYTVDLLNHRFREYLHLDADFDRRYGASGNKAAAIRDRCFAGDDLTERSITAPSRNATCV